MMSMDKVQIGLHAGNVLRMIADRYPTLHAVVLELVQNAIDARAKRCEIIINLKKRTIWSRDNGRGFSVDEFEKALSEIGISQKRASRTGLTPYGQFGIGIIAPVGKCEVYRLISRAAGPGRPRGPYVEFTFDGLSMMKNKDMPTIPREERPEINSNEWWNTFVQLKRLRKERTISGIDFDKLKSDIVDHFAVGINELDLNLTIDFIDANGQQRSERIKPPEFEGEPLPVVFRSGKKCGEVRFKLFRRPRPAIKSKLRLLFQIRGNPFQIPWRDIEKQLQGTGLMDDSITEVFSSGLFEGRIIVEKCKLRVERDGFMVDDALLDFMVELEAWTRKTGQQLIDQIEETRRDTRLQEISRKSLALVEEIIRVNPKLFEAALEQFRLAGITAGHTQVGSGRLAQRTSAGVHRPRTGNGRHPPENPTGPQGEIKKKAHLAASGPKGQTRSMVRGQKGFTLCIQDLDTVSNRILTVLERGELIVNRRHPNFEICEKKDTWLGRYVELLTIWELSRLSMPEQLRDAADMMEESFISAAVFNITHESLAGRMTQRRVQTKKAAAV